MNELELNLVLSLVDQPSLVQTHVVKPEWFSNKKLAQLIQFLNARHGDFSGFGELRQEYSKAYPQAMIDSDWKALANSKSLRFEFNGYLKELKQRYQQQGLAAIAKRYVYTHSQEDFNEMREWIKSMETVESSPVESMNDLKKEFLERLEKPIETGVKTFPMLDDFMGEGLEGGQLLVVGARPAVGKSAFAMNLLVRAAQHNKNMRCDLFSLEMSNQQNYRRLVAITSQLRNSRLKNPYVTLNSNEKKMAVHATDLISSSGINLYDNQLTIEDISREIRQNAASAQKGRYLAVVDYLQLVTSQQSGHSDRRQEVEYVSRTLKKLTNELGIPIVYLSQLSRAGSSRKSNLPVLTDLRESGVIEQDANTVAFLYNGEDVPGQKQTDLIFDVQKNRDGETGKTHLIFNKPTQTMKERLWD